MNINQVVKPLNPFATASLLALTLCVYPTASAQDSENEVEEITVIGSFLRNRDTYNATSPIFTLDAEQLARQGTDSLAEVAMDLTINYGSQYRTSSFVSGNLTGTANLNLRGLGLGATLVLLNGRRMTLSAISADDGSQFVDLNNLPLNVIARFEVLKDGASALYGSDAVAGVANIITRQIDGVEVGGRYASTTSDSQEDITVDIALGFGNERGHFNAFYTYFDRSPLHARDRTYTFDTFIAPVGFPGTFLPLGAFGPVGPLVADPDCLNTGPQNPADNFLEAGTGFCLTDETNDRNFEHLVAEEQRHVLYIDGRWSVNDALELKAEYSFVDRDASRARGSSLPLLIPGSNPFISSFHPNFPPALAAFPGAVGAVPILIKPVPNGTRDRAHEFDYETQRIMGGFTFDFVGDWSVDVGAVYSKTDHFNSLPAITTSELQLAVLGLGGTACNPATGIPGAGPCEFYNIFGSSIVDPSATNFAPNSSAVVEFITSPHDTDKQAEMTAVDATFSGTLFETSNGPVSGAFGAQYRKDSLDARFDDDATNGNFTFFSRSSNFEGSRDSYAVFGELALPVSQNVDLLFALRYEDYGNDGGDTWDPKIGVGWQVNDWTLLRASYGTSFRAPTPLHLNGFDSTAQAAQNICGSPQNGAIARFVQPDKNLIPEESTSYTIGVVFSLFESLDLSIDYWNYDYENVIGLDSPQGIINSACAVNPLDPSAVDPRITSAGPVVQEVSLQFENLGRIETDGIDASVRWVQDTSYGEWDLSNTLTYNASYDITSGAGLRIDGLGQRNNLNFGRPLPEFRNNTVIAWTKNNHSAAISAFYIDSYIDDTDGSDIDSFFTVDLRYSYFFQAIVNGVELAVGVLNVSDEDPPRATGIHGFDSFMHDPRGRLAYIQLKAGFNTPF